MNHMHKLYLKQTVCLIFVLTAIGHISGCKKSSPQYKTITENDVLEVIDEVRKATLAKDIDGVIKHLAPFVIINLSMETPVGMQMTQMSRDQYKEELQKVYSKVTHHEYQCENVKITINDDSRSAIVETDIIERLLMDGQDVRTKTHEKTVIEIIDGRLLVTSLDAVVVKI
jgi:hypothetical protein